MSAPRFAFVCDGLVEHPGSASPRVSLAPGAWAEVQIPKFGDPPPLAVDVCSDASLAQRRIDLRPDWNA